jgi:hypothetical protein
MSENASDGAANRAVTSTKSSAKERGRSTNCVWPDETFGDVLASAPQ